MAKSKKKWVALSQEQLQLESASSSAKMVGENHIHSVEPIPDHDWVGGTWGLFWSDYEDELRELKEEDPEKYIKKHPEDKFNPHIFEAKILTCPLKEKTPEPVQAPPPPVQAPPPPPTPLKAPQPAPTKPVAKVKSPPKDLSVHSPVEPKTVSEMVICNIGVLAKFEQKYDEGQNYINKHKEGSNKELKVCVTTVQCLTCPEQVERPKTPPPTPPDVPCPKLRDNALHPALAVSNGFECQSIENENNKWNWMKEDDKSAGRTKYRLSMFW